MRVGLDPHEKGGGPDRGPVDLFPNIFITKYAYS